jgi:hypothetical protein
MLKRVVLLFSFASIVLSCGYDNPEAITDVILTDKPNTGLNQGAVSMRLIQTYNSSGLGYATYNSLLGFDTYVYNDSDETIYDVQIELRYTEPFGYDQDADNEFDQTVMDIGLILAYQERKPNFRWTVGDNNTYLGNIYLFTPEQGFGYTNVRLFFKITYLDSDFNYREVELSQTVNLN